MTESVPSTASTIPPRKLETPSPRLTDGVPSQMTWGQGHTTDARMKDSPQAVRGFQESIDDRFETTVLCVDGPAEGLYLGSVH